MGAPVTRAPGSLSDPPRVAAPPVEGAQPQYGVLQLGATYSNSGQPIRSGLVWRVLEDRGDGADPVIVARSNVAEPALPLAPGNYIVHAAYGFSSATRRVTMQWSPVQERITINAGALRLKGAVGGSPLPAQKLSFAVWVPQPNNSEGRLVIAGAKADETIRLPEGNYHVVSTYGDANAIMRADLKVEPGIVTEATLNHRAATVTLKLVGAEGGEAFAGTAFSVLTPGGDVIREAIGSFPTVTLAEGDYVLIARHEGQVYTREFRIESGLDRDIEVLAKR